ncbi:uncharacterized protein LOC127720464 [Mytilus californianus]|uniref:uncharacterized protein LOC127720464 n=1 Tax=Mytilus californianus TaxID=6549 RepID=UPI0022470D81|nr:uncharacterized protein LOC127720464 [Mytilus californianus]
MSALSSVPAVLKLNHAPRDSMGPFNRDDGNTNTYDIPLKQYKANYNTPTLGDILRGADSITSITFNSSVLHKITDSGQDGLRESPSTASRLSPFRNIASPSYNTLLTSTANARPIYNTNRSAGSSKNENQIVEDSESLPDSMKLKGSKYKVKDNNSSGSKESKTHISKKGRRSRKRSRSAIGRSKGQNVVDRLYQPPTSNGTKTPSSKPDIKLKPQHNDVRDPSIGNGLSLGAMQISLCKPVTIHNNKPDRRDTKSEVPRRYSERVYTASTSKSLVQKEIVDVPKEAVVLPLVTNSSLVKSITQTEIVRRTNNYFSPSTQKLPMHMGGSAIKNQNQSDSANKVTKIYLSDKHSGTVKDCGIEIPCAPPATPTAEQLRKVEYIPSLTDIRSQRAVKVKLQVLEKEAQKRMEKQQIERDKIEKQNKKLMEKDLKQQQRLQIYALNKVMTELENSRFKEFCAKKGIKMS